MADDDEQDQQASPAGAWVELLGDVRGLDVALVDATGGQAKALLHDAGASVREVPASRIGELAPGSVDRVAVAGVRLDSGLVLAAAAALRPDGALLLVVANRASPLAWLDRARRRSTAPLQSLSHVAGLARAAGAPPRREYGLLRSVEVSSTVIDLGSRAAAARVLAGSNTLNSGLRRRAVELLELAAARGQAGRLMPGLAVLCCAAELPYPALTGRIGVLGSAEVKLLYGDPPVHVDKVYASERAARAEADALAAVNAVWPGLAPQLLERRSPVRNRMSWVPGRTLAVERLAPEAGRRWVVATATLLGELHRRLGPGPDGSVLQHGDLWLGNLLVDDAQARVVGLIDWTESARGSADVDLDFLVGEEVRSRGLGAREADELRRAAGAAYAAGLREPSGS